MATFLQHLHMMFAQLTLYSLAFCLLTKLLKISVVLHCLRDSAVLNIFVDNYDVTIRPCKKTSFLPHCFLDVPLFTTECNIMAGLSWKPLYRLLTHCVWSPSCSFETFELFVCCIMFVIQYFVLWGNIFSWICLVPYCILSHYFYFVFVWSNVVQDD